MSHSLDLALLRRANVARQAAYRNANGERVDCTAWSLEDWFCATVGELGEAANITKKIRRGDFTLDEARESLAKELADTLVYLDLLAWAAGIDLAAATEAKFNEVNQRIGYPVQLREHQ